MLIPMLAVLDLSPSNLLISLVIIIVVIILFVAAWRYIAPLLGQFAYLVAALIAVVVIILVAHILGLF